jgi:hypothetical protein
LHVSESIRGSISNPSASRLSYLEWYSFSVRLYDVRVRCFRSSGDTNRVIVVPVDVRKPAIELSRSKSIMQMICTIMISARIHTRKLPNEMWFLKHSEMKNFTAQMIKTVVLSESMRLLRSVTLIYGSYSKNATPRII